MGRWAGPLELYAAQWTPCPGDVVQEAFVLLISQVEWPANPVAWLYRTVRHRALNAARSQRRRAHHERSAASRRPRFVERESVGSDPLDSDELIAALNHLAIDEREIVVARIWGQLTYEEIAELVGVSLSTVYRRYQSGLAQLRIRLASWNSIPKN